MDTLMPFYEVIKLKSKTLFEHPGGSINWNDLCKCKWR